MFKIKERTINIRHENIRRKDLYFIVQTRSAEYIWRDIQHRMRTAIIYPVFT